MSLLEQIDAVLVENKEEKLRSIRTLYAHLLFKRGEYDKALSLFQELDTYPAEVIRLYPELISGPLASTPDETLADEENESLLSPVRKKKEEEEKEKEKDTPSRPASILSARSGQTSKTSNTQQNKPAHVPLQGLNLHDAVSYLIRFLTDKRQRLSKKLAAQEDEDLLQEATLVDTTLLKSYMMTNDALVGPLLRVQNHCDVQECETILSNRKVAERRVLSLVCFAHAPIEIQGARRSV